MLGNKEIMARNIQYYMRRNRKNATEVCRALGIKQNTFSNWVNGKIYPRIDKIEMLANYFGVSKADLVEEHSRYLDRIGFNQEREAARTKRALELYSSYEQAPKSVQETIDMILKSAQQKP